MTRSDVDAFFHTFIPFWGQYSQNAVKVQCIIAPSYLHLPLALQRAEEAGVSLSGLHIAAQNCAEEEAGAFTGEISAAQLKELGVSHVILGHSERRTLFGETDEQITRKVRQAIAHNLTVILCVGETAEERDSGGAAAVVERQLNDVFEMLAPEERSSIIVAYEPVWAIGSGEPATVQDAEEMAQAIHQAVGDDIAVVYGGSITGETSAMFMGSDAIDGVLVGSASTRAQEWELICRAASA